MVEIEHEIVFCCLRCWQEKFVVRWFYWSAQTIRVVSQIYREQNNRGDVSQSGNTDDTITDKTDWTIPTLLSLVVVIWNGKGKYLWMKLLLAFSLKRKRRNGILIIDVGIPRFTKQRYLHRSVLSLRHILYLILPCFGEASKLC